MRLLSRSLPSTAAAIVVTTAVLAGPALADSHTAGDTYTAPAPTKVDRAGADQDEYCIPAWDTGNYRVNSEPVFTGCYPTKGATSVTIVADYNAGSWTFDYSTDPGPAAAADTFAMVMGTCMNNPVSADDTHRFVSVSMTNTADAGGRYIPELSVRTFRGREPVTTYAEKSSVEKLEDGHSATIDLFSRSSDGSPDIDSGMRSEETWTIKVFRSDGGRAYPVFAQEFYVPSCQMTRVKRGYSKTRVTITAHDYWGADTDRRFRIRLLNKRGRTVYRQAVPVATGTARTIVLKKSSIPKRILAKGIPEIVVEQYNPNGIHDTVGDGLPATHWGADYGGAGYNIPAWKTHKRQ